MRQFTAVLGNDVTPEQLKACADLFSSNYAIWGREAPKFSRFLKEGFRVRMSPSKLQSECLACPAQTQLITCHEENVLVGHAFSTTWEYEGKGTICWVTQLVVKSDRRRQGIATELIRSLKRDEYFAYGIASSHPAACMALCKAVGSPVQTIDLAFIKQHAPMVLASSPVKYLSKAELKGVLFEEDSADLTVVSNAFTNYYVDHQEPLEVLGSEASRWPLGALLEGHEFLVLVHV